MDPSPVPVALHAWHICLHRGGESTGISRSQYSPLLHLFTSSFLLRVVMCLLLVAMPFATNSVLVTSSYLLLVVIPGATSSKLYSSLCCRVWE